MPDYAWPDTEHRTLIGKRIPRVDSPAKVSGQAKYTYDVRRPGMLYGKVLRCPYAHAKIISVDTSAAQKIPGVKAIHIVQQPGSTIFWAGDDVVAIAAVDEPTAEDAARVVKIEYQKLPHFVSDAEPPPNVAEPAVGPLSQIDIWDLELPEEQIAAEVRRRGVSFRATQAVLAQLRRFRMPEVIVDAIARAPYRPLTDETSGSLYQRVATETKGDPDKALVEAEVVSEGLYGCSVITHCCLESHGSIMEWPERNQLFSYMSTQGVSAIGAQLADPLNVPAANIRVHQDHIGGGFGSKFAVDRWHVAAAHLSRKAGGQPVRIMLERDAELEVAGARPSAYARVRVAAKRDGTITTWESRFREALDRAREELRRPRASSEAALRTLLASLRRQPGYVERLAIKTMGRIIFLKAREIDWAQASGNYVALHVGRNTHLLRITMTNFVNKLGADQFVRIHRSTVVNLDCIQEVMPWFHGEHVVKLKKSLST